MEEYLNSKKYLRHVKRIAELRDGTGKRSLLSTIFNNSHSSNDIFLPRKSVVYEPKH